MSDETDKPSDQPPPNQHEEAPPAASAPPASDSAAALPPSPPEPPSTMVGTVPTSTQPSPPPPPRDLSAGPATIVGTVPGIPYGQPYGAPTGQPGAPYGQPPQNSSGGPIPYHMPPPAGADPYGGPPQQQQPWADHTMPPRGGDKWKQMASSAADFARIHFARAASRDLRSVNVLPNEGPVLEAQGVHDHTVRQYLIWRRSWLYLVLPFAIFSSIVQLSTFFTQDMDLSTMSGFGVFVLFTTAILQMVGYPIAAGLAVWKWDDLKFSRWALIAGFFAAYLLPFLVALIPFGNFIVIEETDPQIIAGQKLGAGIAGALLWLFTLLPAVLAIMPGILRASARIKSLLPESIVPGWLIVMTAPFFTLVLLVVFVVVNQIAGNLLLILGVLLLMASPAVFLMRFDLLVKPVTQVRERRQLELMQLVYVVVIGVGMALLLLYCYTLEIMGRPLVGDVNDPASPALITTARFSWEIISFVITYMAKSIFVTAVAIDLFMLLNLSVWKNLKAFEGTEHAANYDQIMGSFQSLVEGREGTEGPFKAPPTRAFEVVQR